MIVDDDGSLGEEAVTDINALRMRTQEGFPNFGVVDDIANFEQIQRGLMAVEDEWVYMNCGLGVPDRIKTQRPLARSLLRRPTKLSCASISRNGSG